MVFVSACPESANLQRLLLGRLPLEEAEHLAQHLLECERCLATLHDLKAEDTLVEAMRRGATLPEGAESAVVDGLIERLKQWQPLVVPPGSEELGATLPSQGSPEAGAATQPPGQAAPAPPPVHDTEELYDFLAPPQQPGELGRLGPYRVMKVLGAGGMGVVFLAEDPHLQRLVALKAMKPTLAASGSAKQRFLREARAAAAIEHDNIVSIYQVSEDRGVPFLAMPFLKGETLEDRLLREGPLPLREVLRIGRETARGLGAAHKRGLVHRDIKPANIWLEAETGRVKIVDFGLVRVDSDLGELTQPGAIMGTPAYMAPEQAAGDPVDRRCDLFSLGCVLYRMATGQAPFKGASPMSIVLAVMQEHPRPPREVNPQLPPGLSELVMQLLAKERQQRPSSASAVIEALDAGERDTQLRPPLGTTMPAGEQGRESPSLVPSGPTVAFAPLLPGVAARPRRRVMLVAAAALVGVLGLVSAAYFLLHRPTAPDRPPEPSPGQSAPTPLAALPLEGWLDLRIWKQGPARHGNLPLQDPLAVPLKANDEVRVEAQLNRPAYLYVLWIDSEGKVAPIYPWRAGHWEDRPAQEEKRARLSLPEEADQGWPMSEGPSGMETLVLLAREEPLPPDKDLAALLAGLPPQTKQNSQAVVWFENGAVVGKEKEKDRGPRLFDAKKIDDPVLQTQRLLEEKLGPLCDYSRAVSFATQGK